MFSGRATAALRSGPASFAPYKPPPALRATSPGATREDPRRGRRKWSAPAATGYVPQRISGVQVALPRRPVSNRRRVDVA